MKWRSQKGATAVEFAIILPILILLIFGIIEFGFLLFDKAIITNASREGARAGIVFQDPRPTDTEIQTVVMNYVRDPSAPGDPTKDILITFGSDTITTGDIIITPANPRDGLPTGTDLSVTVNYRYDFLLLPGFISGLVGDISAQTVMKME